MKRWALAVLIGLIVAMPGIAIARQASPTPVPTTAIPPRGSTPIPGPLQSRQPLVSPTPDGPETPNLGTGWTMFYELDFEYKWYDAPRSGTPNVTAHAWFFRGPNTSQVRVIEAQLSIFTAESFYDERVADQTGFIRALYPVTDTPFVNPEGCAVFNRVQGDEGLVGLRIGSTICVTETGRYIEVGIQGYWRNPEDSSAELLSYSSASSSIVDRILVSVP